MNRLGVVLVVTLFLWASAFVGIRVAIEHYSPGALALFRFLVASLVSTLCGCLMLSMFTPELIEAVTTAPRSASLVALYLGIGPSAGAYLGWAHIVSKLPISRAVTLLYLVPVLAYLLGWAVLGETPSLLSVVGGIATIAGVALVHRRSP